MNTTDRLAAVAESAVEHEKQRIAEEIKNRLVHLQITLQRIRNRIAETTSQLNSLKSREEQINKDYEKHFAAVTGPGAASRNKTTDDHLHKIGLLFVESYILPDRIAAVEKRLIEDEERRTAVQAQIDQLKKELSQ